jgi:uncharacterized Zn-binding protein involved in type VI secretion
MPAAARQGDPGLVHCSGFRIATASANVYVNNRGAARTGDISTPHLVRKGKKCVIHTSQITRGSSTVFVNNRPMARLGDGFSACTRIAGGSFNVFVG